MVIILTYRMEILFYLSILCYYIIYEYIMSLYYKLICTHIVHTSLVRTCRQCIDSNRCRSVLFHQTTVSNNRL